MTNELVLFKKEYNFCPEKQSLSLVNIFPFHGASYNVFIVTTIHINFNVSANGCHQVAHDFFFRN